MADIIFNDRSFEQTAAVLFQINRNGFASPESYVAWIKEQTERTVDESLTEGKIADGYWNCSGAHVSIYTQDWNGKIAATASVDAYTIARHLGLAT